MVRTCCVEGCKAPWRPDVDLSFFSFPMRNGDLLKEWLQVVPTNNRISKYSRICSNHFEESQYECISGKRFLKKNAVPTIFPHDVAKFKEIIEEVEKLSSTSQHVILQNMIDNNSNDFHDHYNTQEQETFLTYVSLPLVSNVMDEAVQATPQTRVCKICYDRNPKFVNVPIYLLMCIFYVLSECKYTNVTKAN